MRPEATITRRALRVLAEAWDSLSPERRADLQTALGKLDARDRTVFRLLANGYGLREIGELLRARRLARGRLSRQVGNEALYRLARNLGRVYHYGEE